MNIFCSKAVVCFCFSFYDIGYLAIWKQYIVRINKIATRSHMSPTAIERGVMWVCYPCDILISVKVSPSTVFSKSKSLNISALEEDRKTMAFDIKGWLLPLANVRPELFEVFHIWPFAKCLKTRSNYDTVGRKRSKSHIPQNLSN